MADMTCPKCDTTLIRVERNPMVSVTGIFSGFIILFGLVTMLLNILFGLGIIIIGAIIGMTKNKATWLTCPKCQQDVIKIA